VKKAILLAAAFTLFACIAPAGALSPHSPVLIQEDAAQPQTVKPGEEIFIALPSNRSTGYSWSAAVNDAKLISYEGNVYQRRSSSVPGASGQQLFVFHANRSGTTTIAFSYTRPFESNTAPEKTLTFTIKVE
jgi:inhibitor of cysteine peptidase